MQLDYEDTGGFSGFRCCAHCLSCWKCVGHLAIVKSYFQQQTVSNYIRWFPATVLAQLNFLKSKSQINQKWKVVMWRCEGLFWVSHQNTQGNRWWGDFCWSSPQTGPSCWERGWWTCLWTTCCCRWSQTASCSHACGSESRERLLFATLMIQTYQIMEVREVCFRDWTVWMWVVELSVGGGGIGGVWGPD